MHRWLRLLPHSWAYGAGLTTPTKALFICRRMSVLLLKEGIKKRNVLWHHDAMSLTMLSLSEYGFSAIAIIKTKDHMKINMQPEMRVAVSTPIPRYKKICSAQTGVHIPLVSNCGYLRIR